MTTKQTTWSAVRQAIQDAGLRNASVARQLGDRPDSFARRINDERTRPTPEYVAAVMEAIEALENVLVTAKK